jgi:anti-anti-sigma factor
MSVREIRSKLVGDAAIIYPGPYLNQFKGQRVEGRCQEFLGRGIRRVVINFEGTELINSIGVSILLGVIEAVNEMKGTLVLSNLSESNCDLFEILGLKSRLNIADTEENALAAIIRDSLAQGLELESLGPDVAAAIVD